MTEEQMRIELIKIETEWDMCGLSDEGLYSDYAIELAKRAIAVQREVDAGIVERLGSTGSAWCAEAIRSQGK
jgi:hypothetical protein